MDGSPETGFNTPLSPTDEQAFQTWKSQFAPKDSGVDYDLRGAYKAGLRPSPTNGHWPDTFKKPNHPTFSDQSIYAKYAPGQFGTWDDNDQYKAAQRPPLNMTVTPGTAPYPLAPGQFQPSRYLSLGEKSNAQIKSR